MFYPGCAWCKELLFWTEGKMEFDGESNTKKDEGSSIRQVLNLF